MKIRPVILCGGSGTRLWTDQKHHQPKQFIDFGNWTLFGKTLDSFQGLTDSDSITRYTSSHVNALPEFKRSNALHTVAYYTSGYTGTLNVQATLDSQPSNNTDWVDIKSISLSNSSGVTYENVSGVYSWIRIQHIPDNLNNGTLDKVLVRS